MEEYKVIKNPSHFFVIEVRNGIVSKSWHDNRNFMLGWEMREVCNWAEAVGWKVELKP